MAIAGGRKRPRPYVAKPGEAEATIDPLCRDNFLRLRDEWTVGEAISHIRRAARRNHVFYLYVVDSQDRLRGTLSIRHLLTAEDTQQVRDVASPKVVSLPIGCPLMHAYQIFSEARFLSLPVVDDDGVLRGVVLAHELSDEYGDKVDGLFEERSRGQLFELLGIKAEDAGNSTPRIAAGRLPWLLVNIVGGAISAFFIHRFGSGLPRAVEFLAFVPILLIVSESIGMQTASLVIANLHRAASKTRAQEMLLRELLVAGLLGIACAAIVAGTVIVTRGMGPIPVAIAITVAAGAVFVSFLGNAVPFLFHRLKIDPRIAAGPVVLALADCLTLLFYLFVAILVTRSN